MEDIKILEDYIEEVWKQKPIHNVIPDWATIEKREIQAIENLIQRNKELEDTNMKFALNGGSFAAKHYIEDNYIPKSKVQEKIEYLENQKPLYCEKQVIQGRIDLLKELLEES